MVWNTILIIDINTYKAFKTDSQRMAFFIQWLGFVFTAQWFRLGASVAHYLTRR